MNLNLNYIAGIFIGALMAIFPRAIAATILKSQSRVWGFNYGEKDLQLTSMLARVIPASQA